METAAMGRVLTEATLENYGDLWAVEQGLRASDQVRRITVGDALVDSGATLLSVPTRLIQQLGLKKVGTRRVSSRVSLGQANLYDAVLLTIQGRTCTMDVLEVPDSVPVLIGQLPLEHLDFVVDLPHRRLIGNPAHDGEHTYAL